MANIIDYLRWRGDLDFSKSPFNEIDAAIFAMLSYVNLAGIVPGPGAVSGAAPEAHGAVPEAHTDLSISIQDAADQVFAKFYPGGEKPETGSKIIPTLNAKFNSDLEDMLRALSTCPRYANVRISRFAENIDAAAGCQFAAALFTLPLPYPLHVVAFRGTDNTLVGWKEDFGFVYMEQIPAQDSALKYLDQAANSLPGRFIVCGHSKGGNLAVYAGTHLGSANRDRISKIYNFDGPGFNFSLVDPAPFATLHSRIVNFVPEESMVGMLFDAIGERIVVASQSRSANQHNAFFWNAERTSFVRGSLTDSARMLDCILKSWLADLSLPERQAFLEAVFELLGDVDESAISKDPLKNLADIRQFLIKYKQLQPDTRAFINQVLATLSTETRRTLTSTIQKKLHE